ncbi:peptidyl-prolyl cis-trans isomerase [Marinobacter sp. F4218]|uniref:peptidylprolyl isomerase n=1 Tax=Marinobacter sp. F4218 TaxID=2862868 RepID=UPI001C63569C|nr:peptidylprolyl isomerase [Marinobacter sp. F4218]MBW7471989.1 peptidyl-prolyl cis-trans isomerase [Marinobacter sp. F4218]
MADRSIKRLVTEPFVHFLLIGVALFGLYGWLNDVPEDTSVRSLVITESDVAQLASNFRQVWQRPPTREELQRLVDKYVQEEILVREALAMGLDTGDAVIRQRLRQKMEFILDGAVASLVPSDQALREYYRANAERFTTRPKVGFQQVFLGKTVDEATVASTRQALEAGAAPGEVGQATLLAPEMRPSVSTTVDSNFGVGFFDQLVTLPPDIWAGPVQSAFGLHLVKVTGKTTGTVPGFEAIREQVEDAWRRDTAERLSKEQLLAMKSDYDISVPDVDGVSQ